MLGSLSHRVEEKSDDKCREEEKRKRDEKRQVDQVKVIAMRGSTLPNDISWCYVSEWIDALSRNNETSEAYLINKQRQVK